MGSQNTSKNNNQSKQKNVKENNIKDNLNNIDNKYLKI